MNILSNSKKKFIRKIAREEYLVSCELLNRNPKNKKKERKQFILDNSRRSISIRLKNSNQFQSVIGQILISVAIKLAMNLVEKWIEDNIFKEEELSQKFQQGEPGYVKR